MSMALNVSQWEQAFAASDSARDFAPTAGHRSVLVGLLGAGITASRTPAMHRAEGAAQGLALDYRLIDTDTSPVAEAGPAAVGALLDRVEAAGYDGINVTYPFKQAVIPHLSELAPAATAVGAVNTVLFRKGSRIGENTDHWGFAESLRRSLPDAPRENVLLLGAGGAGGAVALALLDEGARRVLIHDMDKHRATVMAERLGKGRAEVVTALDTAAAVADGIVNATPMGMAKQPGLPLPEALVTPRHWVGDIVYFPPETQLLALARRRGCRVLPGSGMALFQAVRAFELFTGLTPDPDRMWAAFTAAS